MPKIESDQSVKRMMAGAWLSIVFFGRSFSLSLRRLSPPSLVFDHLV